MAVDTRWAVSSGDSIMEGISYLLRFIEVSAIVLGSLSLATIAICQVVARFKA
jgi:hypothetical protein